MKWLSLVALLVTIIFSNCSDDSSGLFRRNLLLKKIYRDGKITRKCEYGAEDKIKKISYYNDGGELTAIQQFIYTNDTMFQETYTRNNELFSVDKYYWLDAVTATKERYNSVNELQGFETYEHYLNCGYRFYNTYDRYGNIRNRYEADFRDDKCSYILEQKLSNGEDIWYHFRSDGKRFYGESMTTMNFHVDKDFMHNYTTAEYHRDGNLLESISYTSVFDYNISKYPKSEERTYYDGEKVSYTYEYY